MNSVHRKYERKFKIISWIIVLSVFTISLFLIIYGNGGYDILPALSIIIAGSFSFANKIYRKWDYCVIHPYFERKLPPPGAKTMFNGIQLAKELDEIDKELADNKYRTLSSFGYKDSFKNSGNDWFNADDGIIVIDAIKKIGIKISDGANNELMKMRDALLLANDNGIRFCLHMRHMDGASGAEFDRREGSYT
jgi:hypothetical protein